MKQNVVEHATTDVLEQRLIELEALKGRICAEQIIILREADQRQTPLADGCRSLQEWTAGRLDVAPETAKQLVAAARVLSEHPQLEDNLKDGLTSFDRTFATARLAAAGASQDHINSSAGFDIAGVRRLTATHRRMTPQDSEQVAAERFLAMQPTLDHSSFRLWGQLPGTDGELVSQALQSRADQFPSLPDGTRGNLGQRNADALVAISQDSLTTTSGDQTSPSGLMLSVFTNSNLAVSSNGDAGSTTASGIQVGRQTIEEILCSGMVEHTRIQDGQPLAVGRTTRVIPPRLRRFILYRDGGCTAAGCTSRYRPQPHHVVPWSEGGTTDPDNLVTLCWFHHHVVVHQMGYAIDPDSPPQRRRFIKPDTGTDPP